jgi:hypothetical protein
MEWIDARLPMSAGSGRHAATTSCLLSGDIVAKMMQFVVKVAREGKQTLSLMQI